MKRTELRLRPELVLTPGKIEEYLRLYFELDEPKIEYIHVDVLRDDIRWLAKNLERVVK